MVPRGRTLHKSPRPLSKWLQGLGAGCMGTNRTFGSCIGGGYTQETHEQTRAGQHMQMRSNARTATTRAYVQTHTLTNEHTAQIGPRTVLTRRIERRHCSRRSGRRCSRRQSGRRCSRRRSGRPCSRGKGRRVCVAEISRRESARHHADRLLVGSGGASGMPVEVHVDGCRAVAATGGSCKDAAAAD
jgi:hypothetical protein